MAKIKTLVDEYKEIFVKLYKHQRKGADTLIALLSRYLRAKADYMATYIDLVSERSGVPATSHITATNRDVMIPIVREMCRINKGDVPSSRDLDKAWEAFIEDYRNHKIKL